MTTEGIPARPPAGACPSCHSTQLTPVIEQLGVPIHTSTLLASREQALAYPKGDVRLVICSECGLLTNTAFDAPAHDYSASYDEVQSFSQRFREYLSELAQTLVDRHALAGRDVFEIGSGRGEFLIEICERTGASGSAVDPSFDEDRFEGPASSRVTIERRFFSGSVPAGVAAVLSRHTLEHVHDVAGFLRSLRQGLEQAADAVVVVFEVPETLRVLEETAFWDIFYEHCCYFTPGSLARAFRAAGLVPERLERTFDDQYLLVTARPGAPGEGHVLPLEEPPAAAVELAKGFAERIDVARREWRSTLQAARSRGESAVIWGAGSKGVAFLSALGLTDEIVGAVDVNPAKHGMFMPGTGHEIVAPKKLVDLQPGIVIVMNPAYTEEIRRDLAGLGVGARVLAL
jgi:methyltransferase family protein/C-methyltransferase-like protein